MKVLFAGTPTFAAGHLDALINSEHQVIAVITQPDKPGKRGKKLVPSAVKVIAERAGLTVIQPDRLTRQDLVEFEADVLVVVAYGQILKPDVLSYPQHGGVNVHTSLLPRWRGAAPVQRTLLAGDGQTGVTLIQMDDGLDTGDMLAKQSLQVSGAETAGTLFDRLAAISQPLLIKTLNQIQAGSAQRQPQDSANSTYASKLNKDEACLDWSGSATQVDRQVRAFNPDPIAHCFLEEKRIKIHEGEPRAENAENSPGEILKVNGEGILVACGDGSYLITRIQLPIGKGSVLNSKDVMSGWTEVLHPDVALSSKPLAAQQ